MMEEMRSWRGRFVVEGVVIVCLAAFFCGDLTSADKKASGTGKQPAAKSDKATGVQSRYPFLGEVEVTAPQGANLVTVGGAKGSFKKGLKLNVYGRGYLVKVRQGSKETYAWIDEHDVRPTRLTVVNRGARVVVGSGKDLKYFPTKPGWTYQVTGTERYNYRVQVRGEKGKLVPGWISKGAMDLPESAISKFYKQTSQKAAKGKTPKNKGKAAKNAKK